MRIAILGNGITGRSVRNYLDRHSIDYDLFYDIAPDEKITLDTNYDKAIVSPGWPKEHNLIKLFKKNRTPIVSELEFASMLIKKPIIAVTGTNGKTTCCNLITAIINQNGLKAASAGNIGTPLIDYVDKNSYDLLVCEVSSFQMEFTDRFKPFVYVLLNIETDHLDRHRSFNEYRALKLKAIKNQDKTDFIVMSLDRKIDIDFNFASKPVYFSLKKPADAYRIDDKIKMDNIEIGIDGLKLKGAHNIENIMAALLASSRFIKLDIEKTEEILKNFAPLEHRLEYVDSVDKVNFVDDSKATNIAAIKSAISSLKDENGKLVLLVGGRYKGGDFSELLDDTSKIRAIVAFGESRAIIRAQLQSDNLYVVPALNLRGAVYGGFNFAAHGDTVLLSPGCSSFDEFESYKVRGMKFKEIVAEIKRDYSY